MNFNKAVFLRSFGTADQLPPHNGVELVFCGRSNVGKSSLINKLCRRNGLAKVSSSPGKTTTINYFELDKGFFLVDLPGYGYAKRSQAEKERWAKLMQRYFDTLPQSALVIQLVDSRHAPSVDDISMLELVAKKKLRCLVVLTKIDKLNKTEYKTRMDYFDEFLQKYSINDYLPFTINGDDCAQQLREKMSSMIDEC